MSKLHLAAFILSSIWGLCCFVTIVAAGLAWDNDASVKYAIAAMIVGYMRQMVDVSQAVDAGARQFKIITLGGLQVASIALGLCATYQIIMGF